MKNTRLTRSEKQAIYREYVAGKKVESISAEFGIINSHVRAVAKRLGAAVRPPWRPSKQKGSRS